jgi:hypothetical protein
MELSPLRGEQPIMAMGEMMVSFWQFNTKSF